MSSSFSSSLMSTVKVISETLTWEVNAMAMSISSLLRVSHLSWCHDLTPHCPVFNPSPTAFPAAHILTFNNFDWPELSKWWVPRPPSKLDVGVNLFHLDRNSFDVPSSFVASLDNSLYTNIIYIYMYLYVFILYCTMHHYTVWSFVFVCCLLVFQPHVS